MPRDPSGHVLDFRCLACGATQPPSWDATTCLSPAHGEGAERGILDVRYNYDGVRKQWKDATGGGPGAGIWRWRPLLPIGAPDAPLLPVGGTPLVPAPRLAKRLGLGALWLLDGEPAADSLDAFVVAPSPGEHRLELEIFADGQKARATASFVSVDAGPPREYAEGTQISDA